MNNTNYIILKANQEQREYVLTRFVINDVKKRDNAIIYVAINNSDEIIGRIIIHERDIPKPVTGKYWFIANAFVHPEYRRLGIATALVDEIKRQAKASDIVYLNGSANPSFEACMFWLIQGFTLLAYGNKYNDESKRLFYGNYHHILSYCIDRKKALDNESDDYIQDLSNDKIYQLINKYFSDENQKAYLLSKSQDLFGFAAVGEDGKTVGAILAFPDSMKAPLNGTYWLTYLYVEPKYRNQGIGKKLVCRLYQLAKEKGARQLTVFNETQDYIGFWYEVGFDVYFWGINSQTGKRVVTAMMSVNTNSSLK